MRTIATFLRIGLAGLAATLSLAGCTESPTSGTKDIFVQDQGDESSGSARRRPATDDEKLLAINLPTCTGTMIAPELMITAHHCKPAVGDRYTSGFAARAGRSGDVEVVASVEDHERLDYQIVSVRWDGGVPPELKLPERIATKASDMVVSADANAGDDIFTVGFPADVAPRWGATYAEGQAKASKSGFLYFNIGIINGSSGGGVWRKRDMMLVGLANGGPNALNRGDWNTGSADDARHWNNGAAMWTVYELSPTLRDVFPNGKNRFVSTTPEDSLSFDQRLFALIGEPVADGGDTFEVALAAPRATASMILCTVAQPAACKPGAAGFATAKLVRTDGDVSIFKLDTGLTLTGDAPLAASIVALDGAGAALAGRSLVFAANP